MGTADTAGKVEGEFAIKALDLILPSEDLGCTDNEFRKISTNSECNMHGQQIDVDSSVTCAIPKNILAVD